MSTYTKFSCLSLATKIRLREKFTSEIIFYRRKYPDLRYIILAHVTWALAWEWALFIRAAKTVTWALTREWALARDTMVYMYLRS